MADDVISDTSFMSSEKMNYRLALLFQINRIGSAPLKAKIKLAGRDDISVENFLRLSKEVSADMLYESVLLFEGMLSPYIDKDYVKEKKDIENTPQDPDKPKGEKKYAKYDNWMEINDYARAIFSALMKCMKRNNLLLEEESDDVVSIEEVNKDDSKTDETT